MCTIKRILVPTDFSQASEAALGCATALARAFGAELYLLHVPGTAGETFEADFPVGAFEQNGWGPRAGAAPAGTAVLRTEYAIRIGEPAHEILRYANDRDVDVIVMGTHGRQGMAHMFVGSVAERVVRAADCPVVTIRPSSRLSSATAVTGTPTLLKVPTAEV